MGNLARLETRLLIIAANSLRKGQALSTRAAAELTEAAAELTKAAAIFTKTASQDKNNASSTLFNWCIFKKYFNLCTGYYFFKGQVQRDQLSCSRAERWIVCHCRNRRHVGKMSEHGKK